MSYCRFQNTLQDLRDCHQEMRNENISNQLSRAESRSFAELVELCREITEMYEDETYEDLKKMSIDIES